MKKEHIDDELKNLSPWLHEQRGQGDGMQVPDNYFSQLEDTIFNRIDAEGHRKTPAAAPNQWTVWTRRLTAIAACFALVAATWWWMRPQSTDMASVPAPATEELAMMDSDDAYIEENIMDFDPEMLAWEEETVSGNTTDQTQHPKPANNLKQENIDELLEELSDEELEDLL
jgi:hypothetical protein